MNDRHLLLFVSLVLDSSYLNCCSSKECTERLFLNSVHRKVPECIGRTTYKFVKKLRAFPVWPMPPTKKVQVKRKHWSYWENTSISWHSILYALSVLETHHLQRWNPRTTQVAAWRSMNPNIESCGDRSLVTDLGIGPLMLVSFVKISSVTNPESYRHAGSGPFFHHRNTDGGGDTTVEWLGICTWKFKASASGSLPP